MQPTRSDVSQFIYICKTLYIFRRLFLPSSGDQNCTYSVRYLSDRYCYLLLAAGSSMALYVQFWAPDDGQNNLKHVERLTEKNKLRSAASFWLYSANILAMHGPMNVKNISTAQQFWHSRSFRSDCLKIVSGHKLFRFFWSTFHSNECLSSYMQVMPKMETEAHVRSCKMPDTDNVWFQTKLASAYKIPQYHT